MHRCSQRPRRTRPAFTLLELIVVIVVLAILALLAVPTFASVITKSHDSTTQASMAALGRDIQAIADLDSDGVIDAGDVTTAVSEMPAIASGQGVLAAAAETATTANSTGPTVISYAFSANGSQAGLAVLAATGNTIYALALLHGPVSAWVGAAQAVPNGVNALSGPPAPTSASSSATAVVYNPSPAPKSFSYTGSAQTYTVPAGVTLVEATASGAQGGNGGGDGAQVTAYLPVSGGEVLYLYLGQQPGNAGGTVSGAPGNFGAGGSGDPPGYAGGGGGGATSIYAAGTSAANLVDIAGGGGGSAGAAGGAAGQIGAAGSGTGGGGGATVTAGGSAGAGTCGSGNTSGSFGAGGIGANYTCFAAGGGGGYYGGGGGGGNGVGGAGGGGGSSWVETTASGVSYASGANAGNGSVSVAAVGAVAPGGLNATWASASGAVTVAWTASPSAGITGYAVFRNGVQIATTGPSATSFTDSSAPQNTSITYGVAATTTGLASPTASTTVVTTVYAKAVLADHPSGYWMLSEATGTTASDSAGGIGPGTYGPGITLAQRTSPTGVAGPTFPGTTSGYVSVPAISTFQSSMDMWVYVPSTATAGAFAKFGGSSSSGWALGIGTGTFDTAGNHLIGLYEAVRWIDTGVNIGTGWHYVAMTVASDGTANFYLDGSLVGQSAGAAPANPGTASTIGNDTYYNSRYWSGSLTDVAFYPQVLTASQVSAHYAAR